MSRLKSRHVAVVFITTPVYKSYYSHLNPAAYTRMQNAIRSMSEQNGIQYYNYMQDKRFRASDFFDCDHLNASGMAKFTAVLKSEVVDPSISIKESNGDRYQATRNRSQVGH
jgi:poly-D-alanine transfer protein DltD